VLTAQGRLGQKNGAGFYRYESDPKGRPRKSEDSKVAELLASVQPGGGRTYNEVELRERLMLPLIIEAVRCIEEGIVATPAEADMGLVLGLGFPRHVGGPLKYADWLGMSYIVKRCTHYASLGPLYIPTEGMHKAAQQGSRFF
jgi:3-hydroxyacyl-CoA dehydrogenase/enoyl-CoA hydratase/3-hydroxybutyryl-CoA epimerase/enoyl-CoA isomerase